MLLAEEEGTTVMTRQVRPTTTQEEAGATCLTIWQEKARLREEGKAGAQKKGRRYEWEDRVDELGHSRCYNEIGICTEASECSKEERRRARYGLDGS